MIQENTLVRYRETVKLIVLLTLRHVEGSGVKQNPYFINCQFLPFFHRCIWMVGAAMQGDGLSIVRRRWEYYHDL